MKAVGDPSGSVAGIVEGTAKCEQCGTTTRLDNGLLRELSSQRKL